MTEPTAAAAGCFKVGGAIEVNRLGFGAMRVTGAGVWGPPADRAEALCTLRRWHDRQRGSNPHSRHHVPHIG